MKKDTIKKNLPIYNILSYARYQRDNFIDVADSVRKFHSFILNAGDLRDGFLVFPILVVSYDFLQLHKWITQN